MKLTKAINKLENEKEDFKALEKEYKRLIILNKHVENIFKKRSKEISDLKEQNDRKQT